MTKQFLFAAVAASVAAATASADLVCGWSMPTAVPAATTGGSYNYGAADQGTGAAGSMLSSAHAVAATTYSSPTGNGSTYSFSTNNWTIGDNYQVAFSTIGSAGLSISWDQTRSGTGPPLTPCSASMVVRPGPISSPVTPSFKQASRGRTPPRGTPRPTSLPSRRLLRWAWPLRT